MINRIIISEIQKLLKSQSFVFLFLLLLFADFFYMLFYTNTRIDSYASEATQNNYENIYKEFVYEMESRAEKANILSSLTEKNTYSERNIKKTLYDYKKLGSIQISSGNNLSIVSIINYNSSIFFFLGVIILLVYYLIFLDRNKGIYPLLKGTKNGRYPLAISKFSVCIIFSIIYTLLDNIGIFVIQSTLYGFNDFHRSIQSISAFRCSIHNITIIEALFFELIIRICVAIFFSLLFISIGSILYSEVGATVISVCITSIMYFLYCNIDINGKYIFFKCVNPFFLWNISLSIGEYQNINICGYPISKELIQLVCFFIISICIFCIGLIGFCKKNQIRYNSIFEKLNRIFREKTQKFRRHVSLNFYEVYKSLICEKKIIALIILIIFFFMNINNVISPNSYRTFKEATYHLYLDELEGKITEDKLLFIADENNRIYDSNNAEYFNIYGEGFSLVKNQYKYLSTINDDILNHYFVDESAYLSLWGSQRINVIVIIIYLFGCVILISGLYPYDDKKKMQSLLNATTNGYKKLNISKLSVTLFWIIISYTLYEIPQLLRLYKIDQFKCINAEISDITSFFNNKSLSIGTIVLIVMILRFFTFFVVGISSFILSKHLLKESITIVLCFCCIIVIGLLFYIFSIDYSGIILHFLQY